MYNSMTKHIELAGTVTVGPKGQVVIPIAIREQMSIEPGSRLVALYLPDKRAIGFVTEDAVQSIVDRMGDHISVLKSSLSKEN